MRIEQIHQTRADNWPIHRLKRLADIQDLDAAFSSLPQGRVRQIDMVQNSVVVFLSCNTPGTKRIWAVRFVGSKKKKKGRQWKTIDRHQQDNLPTTTPPFKPLATYQYQCHYQLHSKFWVANLITSAIIASESHRLFHWYIFPFQQNTSWGWYTI